RRLRPLFAAERQASRLSLRPALLVLPAARLLSPLRVELLGAAGAHALSLPLHLLWPKIPLLPGLGLPAVGISRRRLLPRLGMVRFHVPFTPYSCAVPRYLSDGCGCSSAFCAMLEH